MSALRFVGPLGKFTWRMLATILAGQALVIFFGALVARALADAQGESQSGTFLWVGSGLAVLAIVAAGLMRRPIGVTLGWIVQVGTFAAAFVVPMMAAVGLLFGGLWVYSMVKGGRIDAAQAAAH